MFDHADWSFRGAYMTERHGITLEVADEALADVDRVVIEPDYNSTSGRSIRVIGFSLAADDIITVIVLEHNGVVFGVNGWIANTKDRRIYNEGGTP